MDSAQTITHVSLCAGYGGIDIGLKRSIPNLRTIAFSEIEAFACANLVAKMEAGLLDQAPIWTDLKTFPWSEFRDRVDILSGGYPCQPFSAAGKRQGADDPRHLWPYIATGIIRMQPRVCFFENVEGHISLGLPDVIEDLAGMGYRTTWGIFSASEVGAPHQRKRVFILAHRKGFRCEWWRQDKVEYRRQVADGFKGSGFDVAYRRSEGLQGCGRFEQIRLSIRRKIEEGHSSKSSGFDSEIWPSRPGEQQFAWEPPRVIGAVPAKLADFCSGDQQPRHDAAPAGSQGVGPGQQGEDANADCGSGLCGGDQEAEAMGNSTHRSNGEQQTEQQGRHSVGGSGEEGAMGNATSKRPGTLGAEPTGQQRQAGIASASNAMGNTNSPRPQERSWKRGSGIQGTDTYGGADTIGQTQSPLGRDADGTSDWLDYAKLYTTSDNRTDELRLLGNGVVPATAERAFRILSEELTNTKGTI